MFVVAVGLGRRVEVVQETQGEVGGEEEGEVEEK